MAFRRRRGSFKSRGRRRGPRVMSGAKRKRLKNYHGSRGGIRL